MEGMRAPGATAKGGWISCAGVACVVCVCPMLMLAAPSLYLSLALSPPHCRFSLKITLGIHRSDYMLHHAGAGDGDGSVGVVVPLQVEINTIAASFASLASLTQQLHSYDDGWKGSTHSLTHSSFSFFSLPCSLAPSPTYDSYLARRLGYFNEADPTTQDINSKDLPENHAMIGIVDGLAEAWKLLGDKRYVPFG